MTVLTRSIRFIAGLFYGGLLAGGILMFAGVCFFFHAVQNLPQVPEPLSRIIETPPTEIYASTGELLMRIGGHENVPLRRISPYFLQAILAIEDHRFQWHHGINKNRILKALYITLCVPTRVEGGSTITQQLAKNLFFNFRRSYLRKFQEILVALQIESRFSKSEILEAYVNHIAFGLGAKGVEQAARTFFNKPAAELNLAEAALLAGIPKSPVGYNPYRHFKRSKKRQQLVLKRMVQTGYLRKAEAAEAYAAEIHLREYQAVQRKSNYFLDFVLKTLEAQYGPEILYHGGLKVTTTLDPRLQSIARLSLKGGLNVLDAKIGIKENQTLAEKDRPSQRPQGALVAIECNSGAVKAMIGGRQYHISEFNRAVQSNRQPGSGFKPFLYYTALDRLGMTPATVMIDQPVRIPVAGSKDWLPQNFTHHYQGAMILKEALVESVNTIAAQLIHQTGPDSLVATARLCGIESQLKPVYSLALGTMGVSPLEMAASFSTFATEGVRYPPFWIWRVEDARGNVLEEMIIEGQRVLKAPQTYQLVDMMQAVIDRGTGRVIRKKGFTHPAAGKTGTTNDYKDAWFTGFTTSLCTSVWVGYDRNQGLRNTSGRGITGGAAAAPIWADFMIKATENDPQREFKIPAGIRRVAVNAITGCVAPAAETPKRRVALLTQQKVCGEPAGGAPTNDAIPPNPPVAEGTEPSPAGPKEKTNVIREEALTE